MGEFAVYRLRRIVEDRASVGAGRIVNGNGNDGAVGRSRAEVDVGPSGETGARAGEELAAPRVISAVASTASGECGRAMRGMNLVAGVRR